MVIKSDTIEENISWEFLLITVLSSGTPSHIAFIISVTLLALATILVFLFLIMNLLTVEQLYFKNLFTVLL